MYIWNGSGIYFKKQGTLEYLEVLVSNEDHQSYRDLILVISMLIDMG